MRRSLWDSNDIPDLDSLETMRYGNSTACCDTTSDEGAAFDLAPMSLMDVVACSAITRWWWTFWPEASCDFRARRAGDHTKVDLYRYR